MNGGTGRGVHQAVLAEIVERRGNTVEASKKLVRERNGRDTDLERACPAEIFCAPTGNFIRQEKLTWREQQESGPSDRPGQSSR